MFQKICEGSSLVIRVFMFLIFNPGPGFLVPGPRKSLITSHHFCDKLHNVALGYISRLMSCPAFSHSLCSDAMTFQFFVFVTNAPSFPKAILVD